MRGEEINLESGRRETPLILALFRSVIGKAYVHPTFLDLVLACQSTLENLRRVARLCGFGCYGVDASCPPGLQCKDGY